MISSLVFPYRNGPSALTLSFKCIIQILLPECLELNVQKVLPSSSLTVIFRIMMDVWWSPVIKGCYLLNE